MGDQADDILTSFKLSATQLKRCHTVRKKFDEHFLVRRNVIFGRAKFVQHRQEEAETADMFITTLHALSERCNFGELKDELIRETTVIGFKDSELSEKFQVDLTLMKAISQARSYQKAANTFSEWFKESTDIKRDVDAVNAKRSPNKFKKELYSSSRKNRKKPPSRPLSTRGERCGKLQVMQDKHCPAKEATYHKYSTKGHSASVCKTSAAAEIEGDDAILGEIGTETDKNFWSAEFRMKSIPFHFKIDTKADVTVIPESIHKKMGPAPDRD